MKRPDFQRAEPSRVVRPDPLVEPPRTGIGNFTGKFAGIGNKGSFGVWLVVSGPTERDPAAPVVRVFRPEPHTKENFVEPKLGSALVQTACRLFARTGHWESWFVWIVGWPVDRKYIRVAHAMSAAVATAQLEPAPKQRIAPAHVAQSPLIAVGLHACLASAPEMDAAGRADEDNVITCSVVRRWRRTDGGDWETPREDRTYEYIDSAGCGARFGLDRHGIRRRL